MDQWADFLFYVYVYGLYAQSKIFENSLHIIDIDRRALLGEYHPMGTDSLKLGILGFLGMSILTSI